MPHEDIVLDPVDHITVDALGKPGKRIFYLQALKGKDRISLLIEKFQLQSLLEGAKEFFTEINSRYPHLEETFIDFKEEDMRIDPPVDPLFRSGDMGLAYDENRDRVCVFAQEAIQNSEERRMVRFWCNRAQLA